MARSVSEIYDSLIAEKESFSSLDGLAPAGDTYADLLGSITSSSKTAIWRLVFYIVAYFTHWQEILWDRFQLEVETLLANAKYGSIRWYAAQALLFQYGDTLSFDLNFPIYDPVDASKRIVTHASAIEDAGASATVFVKVAKTTAGSLGPLSAPELISFQAYMNQIRPAGVKVQCSSLNADLFRVQMEIVYDPIRLEADVQTDVEAAIESYLSALPFDARFTRLGFEDALQAVTGVLQIKITSMEGVQGANVTLISQEYVAAAGYMVWDDVLSNILYTV